MAKSRKVVKVVERTAFELVTPAVKSPNYSHRSDHRVINEVDDGILLKCFIWDPITFFVSQVSNELDDIKGDKVDGLVANFPHDNAGWALLINKSKYVIALVCISEEIFLWDKSRYPNVFYDVQDFSIPIRFTPFTHEFYFDAKFFASDFDALWKAMVQKLQVVDMKKRLLILEADNQRLTLELAASKKVKLV